MLFFIYNTLRPIFGIRGPGSKLMQLDRPPAKIRSKSYLNQLLIDFCDTNPAVRSIIATISIRIRIQILILNLIYTENWSIMVKIIDKSSRFR